jgi:ubiquinone/menaquinone biosynthesis C-methylase UbiE
MSQEIGDRSFPAFVMDNFVRRMFLPAEKLVSKYVTPSTMVADLGCGSGYFTLPMAKLIGSTGKVYAVDFDPKAIEHLKKKAANHGYEKVIETHVGSAAEIDFLASDSVDFVFAHGLLCCMKDHEGAVGQMNRILKPEGRAYLSIGKFCRRKDPRTVLKEEWHEILRNFKVKENGQGLTNRWALVSRGESESGGVQTENKKLAADHHQISCCSG